MEIILDMGSGNSNPDKKTARKMIDGVMGVDKKRKCVLKYQLWDDNNPQGKNKILTHEIFEYAYEYATKLGFKATASVFDEISLNYLLNRDLRLFNRGVTAYLCSGGYAYQPRKEPIRFNVPFIKIANRRDLYWLVEKIPRTMPAYISYDNEAYLPKCLGEQDKKLYCISKYPAKYEEYNSPPERKAQGISDHTTEWRIYEHCKQHNMVWEKHYKLPDSTGLDAGPWAITPGQLREIL